MTRGRLQIPGGMQDTLPSECRAKRMLESELRELFTRWGYQEIETPILEYYEALSDETWGFRPEHVWKTFDQEGQILAVRPDSTMPAARLAAGRLKDQQLPLRLCYLQNACKYERDTLSMLSEQTQAGVELMGVKGPEADAEVIALAVESLRSVGIRDFQLELGQAAFFSGFMEEAGLSPEDVSEVRSLVEEKNSLGIQIYLHGRNLPEDLSGKLMRLPMLYGDERVLETAESMTESEVCLSALRNLRQVVDMLRTWGIHEEISYDLGMAQEAAYYSGTVFRAQTGTLGQVLLSGGRYDGLPARFGRDVPAVGFAMNLKLALIALERQGMAFEMPVPDLEVGFAPGELDAAIARVWAERSRGRSAALVYGATRESMEKRQAMGLCRNMVYLEGKGC